MSIHQALTRDQPVTNFIKTILLSGDYLVPTEP